MKIIDLEQGSEAWFKWRSSGLGASDIPVIMGTLPKKYKTRKKLWNIKCGFDDDGPPNKYTNHGHDCEPKAREWLNEHMELDLQPLCIEHDEIEYFKASLDAYDQKHNILVEIKSPMNTQVLDDAKMVGAVHSYWVDQVLWQMGLVGTEEGYIAVWDYRNDECYVIRVEWDPKRFEKMMSKGQWFWTGVKYGIFQEESGKVIEFEEIQETL